MGEESRLTDTSLGFDIETIQKQLHVEVVEPEQAAVRAVDEVVVANKFIEAFASGQIQYQLPLFGHSFVLDVVQDRLSKSLNFFESVLIVEVCICVDWLKEVEIVRL